MSTPASPVRILLTLQRYLLLGTVALLPLAYAPGVLFDVYNMPKLTLLLVVVALAGSARLASVALGASPNGLRLLAAPAVVMSSAFVASWIFSEYRGWSLLGVHIRYAGLLPYLAVILFGVLLADAFAGRARPIVLALVAGGATVGLVAVLQMLFLGADVTLRSDTGFVTSTLGHSNFAGGYLAIMLPLCVAFWIQPGRSSRWGMAATIVVAAALLFTVSQGAWLAATAGVAVLIALQLPATRRWTRRLTLAAAVMAAATAVGSILFTIALPHAYGRLPGFLATAVSRGFLWRNAVAIGLDRPILGWGPNVFAIEGPLHRSIEDALLLNFVKGDDPHSVPLAMFANLGVVGLVGFLFLFAWAFRSLWQKASPASIEAGLAAAIVAYLVQSLVSVDALSLRFALWVLLAAVAAGRARPAPVDPAPMRATKLGVGAAVTSVALGVAAATAAVVVLALADAKIRQGTDQFAADEPEAGTTTFREALHLRDDPEYRRQFGGTLGDYAYEQGASGEAVIRQMNQVFAYLDDFPDPQALALQAQLLNQWSRFDAAANSHALDIYARARRLDPHNPLLALSVADVLLEEGLPRAAESELEPFEQLLIQSYPEYSPLYSELWAGLAIARIEQGEIAEARATLSRASMKSSCRYLIATQLLDPSRDQESLGQVLAFLCPRPLLQLLPDAASTT